VAARGGGGGARRGLSRGGRARATHTTRGARSDPRGLAPPPLTAAAAALPARPARPPQAIAADPSDAVFFSNRSAARLSAGKAEGALEDGEAAVRLKPTWGKAHSRVGAALHALGDYAAAAGAYEAGLAVEPGSAALAEGLAEARAAAGRAGRRGGGGGGGPPGGNPFGPDMMARLARNPRFLPYLADDAFRAKLEKLSGDPNGMQAALMEALGGGLPLGPGGAPTGAPPAPKDPRMMEVVSFLLGMNLDGGGAGGEGGEDDDGADDAMGGGAGAGSAGFARARAPAPAPAPAPAAKRAPPPPLEPTAASAAAAAAEAEEAELPAEERAARAAARAERAAAKARAAAHKEAGNAAYKERRFDAALAAYAAAAAEDPEDITFDLNTAAVQMETGDLDGAVATCAKAVERGRAARAPYAAIAKAFLRAGTAHAKAGRLGAAVEAFEASLLEQRTEEGAKKLKDARAALKAAEAAAYLDAAKGVAAKEAGNDAFKAGDFKGALGHYTEAVARDPSVPAYYTNRAAARAKLMDFSGALADAEAALKLDPKNARALCRKGNCQFALNELHKALDTFSAVLAGDKDNAEAREGLKRTTDKINAAAGGGAKGDEGDAERAAKAMADPEVQAILRDPLVNKALEDMQSTPGAYARVMRDATMGPKITKLIAAGILRTA